jgi:hypothetical protein
VTAEPEVEPAGPSEVVVSDWVFVDQPPTVDQAVELLGTLKPVWGVSYLDFADFVQPLPQSKKTGRKVPSPSNTRVMVDEKVTTFTLYMSVAGRVQMINRAAELNGWRVDFVPEPTTPTGIPGVLVLGDSIVYRESCVISQVQQGPTGERLGPIPLGSKVGMAWVPGVEQRKNAAASTPFEKVETAARGRAIGAWGIGVLPGSGIASLDEMQAVEENQRAAERIARRGPAGAVAASDGDALTQPEMIEQLMTLYEEVRQRTGRTEEQIFAGQAKFVSERLGASGAVNVANSRIAWDQLSPGQLRLTLNVVRQNIAQLRVDEGTGA